jgi:HEAT repeat protein
MGNTTRFQVSIDLDSPQRVGKLARSEATRFLRERLRSPQPPVVYEALTALTKMRDIQSIQLAISLLAHSEARLRGAACLLLGTARDQGAGVPLVNALDRGDDGLRPDSDGSPHWDWRCAHALAAIGDRQAVPALLRAAQRDVHGSGAAAATLCLEDCFETLLQVAERGLGEGLSGCARLVQRSNLPSEPWIGSWGCCPITNETAGRWRTWWERHKSQFRLEP